MGMGFAILAPNAREVVRLRSLLAAKTGVAIGARVRVGPGETTMTIKLLSAAAALAFTFVASSASAQTGPLDFTLANTTDGVVVQIFISVPSTNDWEEDILGSEVVGSGESVHVTINDGLEDCEYDITVVFNDDTPDLVVMGVDFCAVNGETLTIG